LASAVCFAVAAEAEVDSIRQAPPGITAADGIAGLVRALINAEALTTVFKHLGHEGEAVEATILVECAEEFLLPEPLSSRLHKGSCLDPIQCNRDFEAASTNTDALIQGNVSGS
jgi:hypothetical protein